MAAKYEIWLCNDQGARIADIWGHTMLERMQTFTATRIANAVGGFTAMVPIGFDQTLLRRDMLIQVWRDSKLFRPYFLRGWEFKTRRDHTTLELNGLGVNDLLRRRVINRIGTYKEGGKGAYASTSDDILRSLVRHSQTGGWRPPISGRSRAWANFSVEGDAAAGPKIDNVGDLPFDYLVNEGGNGALQRIADMAALEGTPIYFDVVPLVVTGKKMTLIFRVRKDQPGQDLTGHSVLFSQGRGNLKDATLIYDYSKEENAIYGIDDLSLGAHVDQEISEADHDASIWNRCEGVTERVVMGTGSYLQEHQGVVDFSGEVIDTKGMQYGKQWNFGDRVPVRYRHFQFDAFVKSVTFQVDRKGKEKISARLEYQGDA